MAASPRQPPPPRKRKKPPPHRVPPPRPAPGQQPPPAQQQPATPPAPAPLAPAALVAAVIAALAVAGTVAALAAALAKAMKAAGIGYLALRAVSVLMMSWPQDHLEGIGPAQRAMVRTNLVRRAQFMISACRRVQESVTEARAQGEPVTAAIRAALTTERRWLASHVQASQRRIAAASAVDGMAGTYGNLLGWKAVLDKYTTPGCRRADGRNFRADDPPVVEGSPSYPGGVHPRCRCYPVPAWPGAEIMPGIGGERARR